MIIRITINDNDFTHRLENISRGLISKVGKNFLDKKDCDGYMKFDSLTNPNITDKFTKEQKKFIIDAVSNTIKTIAKKSETPDNAKYIEDNLKISIVDSYKDKWENGEVLYYFSKQNVILEN